MDLSFTQWNSHGYCTPFVGSFATSRMPSVVRYLSTRGSLHSCNFFCITSAFCFPSCTSVCGEYIFHGAFSSLRCADAADTTKRLPISQKVTRRDVDPRRQFPLRFSDFRIAKPATVHMSSPVVRTAAAVPAHIHSTPCVWQKKRPGHTAPGRVRSEENSIYRAVRGVGTGSGRDALLGASTVLP